MIDALFVPDCFVISNVTVLFKYEWPSNVHEDTCLHVPDHRELANGVDYENLAEYRI